MRWRLELTGEPFLVAEGVWIAGDGTASFSVSESGVLAYASAGVVNNQLVWVDRRGQQLGALGPAAVTASPQLSPDGKRFAVARGARGTEDIWLLEMAEGTTSQFTFDPARDASPLWSPDGSRIVFRSDREGGRYNLYEKSSSGAGQEELLYESSGPYPINPHDWSADGRFIVYLRVEEKANFDLWVLPLFGDRQPFPFLQEEYDENQGQLSPDGRWMAYVSNESGRDEVYVQSFPTPGGKRRVSTGGGVQPRWRADGEELFYLASDQNLMAVPVRGETTLEMGAPAALFEARIDLSGTQMPDARAFPLLV